MYNSGVMIILKIYTKKYKTIKYIKRWEMGNNTLMTGYCHLVELIVFVMPGNLAAAHYK